MSRQMQPADPRFHCLLLLLVAAGAGSPEVFVHDPAHGNVKMGVPSDLCDNGKTNLDKDWDGLSDRPFACTPSRRRAFDAATAAGRHGNWPVAEFHLAEPAEPQLHICTGEAIRYSQRLPTNGAHRPLWPVWGRYTYLPPQRWLHSLEHGGIVGLHHPCAPTAEADAFAGAIAGCLRRHVISADALRLTPERPFALIAFRNKVLLARFNLTIVQDFIVRRALQGPEHLAFDGQYNLGLISPAGVVSDYRDSHLCPNRKMAVAQAGS